MNIGVAAQKLQAVWRLALDHGPEGQVAKSWLFRNSSKMDQKFAAARLFSVSRDGNNLRFEMNGEVFLWPASCAEEVMVQVLSEHFTSNHPHQYQWGPTQIGSDDIVLDIGACEGVFATAVSSRCRRVIAVEPSSTMCTLINELFRIRNQPCPIIKQCLLGDQPSTAYFLENAYNIGASRIVSGPIEGAYKVPVITLDQLVEEIGIEPTFIKCDAEGAARIILSGGRGFLTRKKPRLAIASYHTDSEYVELYNLLKPMGYRITGKGFLFAQGKLRINMLHAW